MGEKVGEQKMVLLGFHGENECKRLGGNTMHVMIIYIYSIYMRPGMTMGYRGELVREK